MAKALTKSQIASEVAGKHGISKKVAGEILEHLAELSYKNAKNTFTLPGLGKLVLVNRAARVGRAGRRTGEQKGEGHGARINQFLWLVIAPGGSNRSSSRGHGHRHIALIEAHPARTGCLNLLDQRIVAGLVDYGNSDFAHRLAQCSGQSVNVFGCRAANV